MLRQLALSIYPRLPAPLKDVACSLEGYRLQRERFGPVFERALVDLRWSQWRDEEQQRAHQLARLRQVLARAARHVPHYRERFAALGLRPDALAQLPDLETLRELPILRKAEVRELGARLHADDIPSARCVDFRTGGTTGASLPLRVTRETIARYFAVAWRMRERYGLQRGMPHATFNGRPLLPISQTRPPFWTRNWAARQTLFSQFHMRADALPRYVEALQRGRFDYVTGYPSALFVIARAILDQRARLPWRCRVVLTSSETLSARQRDTISRAFDAPVGDFYGMAEMVVAASECLEGRYHFDHEVGVVELEPLPGQPELARLYCTGLLNDAAPLIRYDTGDIVRRVTTPCACGRVGLSVERIDGRIEAYVRTPEGALLGRLSNNAFQYIDGVLESQIIQTALDHLRVKIVTTPQWRPENADALRRALRERVGDGMRVELEFVDAIPRTKSGKLRAVISELEPPG